MKEAWEIVKHSWAETGIYEGRRRIALLSIAGEATEETQVDLERRQAKDARLIAAAPDLDKAVDHLLKRIHDNPSLAYYFDPITESLTLLIHAYARARGWDPGEAKSNFTATLSVSGPRCRECPHCADRPEVS